MEPEDSVDDGYEGEDVDVANADLQAFAESLMLENEGDQAQDVTGKPTTNPDSSQEPALPHIVANGPRPRDYSPMFVGETSSEQPPIEHPGEGSAEPEGPMDEFVAEEVKDAQRESSSAKPGDERPLGEADCSLAAEDSVQPEADGSTCLPGEIDSWLMEEFGDIVEIT